MPKPFLVAWMQLPKSDAEREGVREELRALLHALAAACKEDGRISVNGVEYDVSGPIGTSISFGECQDTECCQWDMVYDEHRSLWDGLKPSSHRSLSHVELMIAVDHTTSKWILRPLGQSVPGQRRVEHQAGSPKPDPEIIHPEPEDYDE